MDSTTLTWINTLVILAVVGLDLGLGLYLGLRIVDALARIGDALARIEETASRNERLTLAALERLTPSPSGRA
jgi:hypothetical protein